MARLLGVRGDQPPPELVALCSDEWDRLVGAVTLFCGDRDVAEDAAQEALVRACERWEHVSGLTSPAGWLYRVAVNLTIGAARRRGVAARAVGQLVARSQDELPDATDAIAVRDALAQLEPDVRAAIVLRYYAGLSIAETAVALGCAEGTVKSRTHRGIDALRHAGLAFDEDEEVGDACGTA